MTTFAEVYAKAYKDPVWAFMRKQGLQKCIPELKKSLAFYEAELPLMPPNRRPFWEGQIGEWRTLLAAWETEVAGGPKQFESMPPV